ncbi:hypothetical protein GY45DRAFT_1341544 [Cubamyces sp. BRFM 1775]|nr:hypothetical protein GY45DRAFT_1341544 [Cubamyces sp. BRFM 1775]
MSAASSPDRKKAIHAGRNAFDELWKCYPEGGAEVEDYEKATANILVVLEELKEAGASPDLLEELVERVVKASSEVADSEVWKNLNSAHSPWHHPLYREGFYRLATEETLAEHHRRADEYNAEIGEPEGEDEGPEAEEDERDELAGDASEADGQEEGEAQEEASTSTPANRATRSQGRATASRPAASKGKARCQAYGAIASDQHQHIQQLIAELVRLNPEMYPDSVPHPDGPEGGAGAGSSAAAGSSSRG